MKKHHIFPLVVALCLLLSACGSSGNPTDPASPNSPSHSDPSSFTLELGTKYEVPDYAELTLVRIESTSTVEASMSNDFYYEPSTPGQTFVDVVFDITNTGNTTVSSEDFMSVVATNDSGSEYNSALFCVETDNMSSVSQYKDIAPLAAVRFHAAFSVPENEEHLSLVFDVNGTKFNYDYTAEKTVNLTTELNIGDVLGDETFATAEFVNCEFADRVEPSNTSGSYRYHEVDNSSNTYLVLTFNITNYSEQEQDIDYFIGAKAKFMDKYKYNSFVASEDSDGKGISSYNRIAPLTSAKVFCLIEVPKSTMDKDYTVDVVFNGQTYTYTGQ